MRGRSAAAAALSMAKDAAVASTTIFIMTIPLVSGQHRLPEAPKTGQPKRDAPLFPSPLSQSGFHRCTINDALTALTTQPKSARITCAIDPFQESVARIARALPREAVRIAVLLNRSPNRVSGPVSVAFCEGPKAHPDSNLFKISNRRLGRAAHGRDRYPGTESGAMLGSSRNFAGSCGGRWRRGTALLTRQPRDSSACPHA